MFPIGTCGRLFAMFGCYSRVDCRCCARLEWPGSCRFGWFQDIFFKFQEGDPPKKLSFQIVSSPGPRCSQGGWRRRLRPGGAVAIPCVEAMMTVYKFAWIEFEAVYYTLPTYIYRERCIHTHIHIWYLVEFQWPQAKPVLCLPFSSVETTILGLFRECWGREIGRWGSMDEGFSCNPMGGKVGCTSIVFFLTPWNFGDS